MASITIEAGQLDGVVYADTHPPLDEDRLGIVKEVCERDQVEPFWMTGAQFVLAPDRSAYGDTLSLIAKKRLLEMADVLIDNGDEVTVIETKIGFGYWLFDEDARKTPIEKAAVEENRGSNENSLTALAGMMGGWGPLLAQSDVADIGLLLDADPSNDLSGLREVARNSFASFERPTDDTVSP